MSSNVDPEPSAAAETDQAESPDPTERDTESDPSLDDGKSADWSSEGGATTSGPATDPTAADT